MPNPYLPDRSSPIGDLTAPVNAAFPTYKAGANPDDHFSNGSVVPLYQMPS